MLEFCLLGHPSSTVDGSPLAGVLIHKDLALLYFLAVAGQPQPRSTLAVLLWGDSGETAARGSLRKSLSNLHQCLGDHLRVERDQVALARDRCTVDVWQFEHLAHAGIAAADAVQLQAAADLYRGDFLSGFSPRNAADFDRWVYSTQERLRGLAVHVLTTLSHVQSAAGELGRAITAQRRVLELEPWREESHRDLMVLLAESGQRSEALTQYKACVAVLEAELGVQPDAATTSLAERIRDTPTQSKLTAAPAVEETSGKPAPRTAVKLADTLPAELSPIVGRAAELDELTQLLLEPDCRLVTLCGPGGIGKTRLALALAHRLSAYFDHVALVSLVTANSADELLPTVARALGLPAGSDDALLASLQAANPQLLLVLDNFEHLLPEGVAAVDRLLRHAPLLRAVVTSREALHASFEWRYVLTELSYPSPSTPDSATSGDFGAVHLFLQIARRARPRQPITPNELPHVQRICALVGGMPLGIELAAAQVGSLPCAAIADDLARGVDRLAAQLHDLPERQRSLLASFEASWARLSPHEQDVLAALSVIQGEFTLEAALAIGEATVADIIRLVDCSFVQTAARDRYLMHEVIRQLAARQLDAQPGARQTALARYRDYYVTWANGDLRWLTGSVLPTTDARLLLENHLQHLWHLWTSTSNLEDRHPITLALMAVEQMYYGYFDYAEERYNTWLGLRLFLERVVRAAPGHSGVLAADRVWLPLLADELVDLTNAFADNAAAMYPVTVESCYSDGRLLALPMHIDVGLLYSRLDLLHKYGFAGPPATWDELEHMAAVIQAGERAAGRPSFWGFTWEGNEAEALLCTALEWQHSEGGGTIVEPDGRISVANVQAASALARAQRWIGTISPPDFGSLSIEETALAFERGDTAFVRMWSVYYVVRLTDEQRLNTAITLMPRGSVRHASTLGGRPLIVLRSFRQRQAAFDLIRESSTFEAQRQRHLRRALHPPTLRALYDDPEVLAARPLLRQVRELIESGGLAVRPHQVTGVLYPQVSALYASAVASVLRGEVEPLAGLEQLAQRLEELLGRR